MHSSVKQVLLRHFSRTAAVSKSHYDSLGVTPKATHTDIKNAYYKLSMIYHPDKNKGSDEAARKFRDITSAYEILGNLRLRKLYDKGILHTAGSQFSSYETEAETENKFYKSREKRSKPPVPTGKTDIYNFDEWTRAHYQQTFQRTRLKRAEEKMRQEKNHLIKGSFQSELMMLSILSVVMICIAFFGKTSSIDTPSVPKKKINLATADP